ncbi:hypothetical protein Q3G72_019235 [Acer saccharum]|nr:hypothetical protein Q3G72_019235 [Acer saccharum]
MRILATVVKVGLCEGEEREVVILEVREQLKMLEQQLNGKDFFGGDKIGFVDIVGNLVAFWFPIYQEILGGDFFTPEKFPGLFEWIGKLQEIDLVNECRPPKDKLLAYILVTAVKIGLCEGEEKEVVILEVCEQLKMLEQQLNGKDFFGGDKIGFVDIVGNI